MRYFKLLFIPLFFVSLLACRKEFEPITLGEQDGQILMPLANSHLTIDRLVKKKTNDDFLVLNEDGLVVLVYTNYRKEYIKDFYTLPSFSNSRQVLVNDFFADNPALAALFGVAPAITMPSTASYSNDFNDKVSLDLGAYDAYLDYLIFDEGKLIIELEKNLNHEVQLQLDIPELSQNGKSFSRNITLSSSATVVDLEIDLSGYRLDFLPSPDQNSFQLQGEFKIVSTPGNTMARTDYINLNVGLTNLNYDLIYGDLGEVIMPARIDSLEINAFDNIEKVDLKVKNPKLRFNTYSSTGVPTSIFVDDLKMGNDGETPEHIQLKKTEYPLTYLTSTAARFDSVLTKDSIDNNSIASGKNLSETLQEGKKNIVATTHYSLGDNSSIPYFLSKESFIATEFQTELPLEVNLQSYELVDTLDNEFKQLDGIEGEADFSKRVIRLFALNSFPIGFDMNIILLDEQGQEIAKVFNYGQNKDFVESAEVDANGEAVGEKPSTVLFPISKELFHLMLTADKMVVVASAQTNTPNKNDYVRIMHKNGLKVRMDFLTDYKFKP